MAIERLLDRPRAVPIPPRTTTLYAVDLGMEPSAAWRAAFLRPPMRLVSAHYMPDAGRVGLTGASVYFRAPPLSAGRLAAPQLMTGSPMPTRWWSSSELGRSTLAVG